MRFWISLFVIIAITSCTKFGKNVYVDGRVYNPITGEGIPNIPIKLYRGKIDWGDPLGTASKTLKTTTTDANGYYKLEHLSTPFNRVAIQLNSLDYYPIGWVDYGNTGEAGIKKGKKNHLDYQMVPYANTILKINNISCQGANDSIIINIDNQIHSVNSTYNWILIGCVNWQTNGVSKVPMGYYYYHWRVVKNNITTEYYDTIFYPKNQTSIYEINY